MSEAITIRDATGDGDIATIKRLFMAYAKSLNFDLCFQGFDRELAALPGDYAPPRGALWLAHQDRTAIGCIALRPLRQQNCEMKRLYLTPDARGQGLGRRLTEHCLSAAKQRGYKTLYLDTMRAEMTTAVALYLDLGFREVEPYYDDPIPGIVCYALDLAAP